MSGYIKVQRRSSFPANLPVPVLHLCGYSDIDFSYCRWLYLVYNIIKSLFLPWQMLLLIHSVTALFDDLWLDARVASQAIQPEKTQRNLVNLVVLPSTECYKSSEFFPEGRRRPSGFLQPLQQRFPIFLQNRACYVDRETRKVLSTSFSRNRHQGQKQKNRIWPGNWGSTS